jgi:hypothetical protein
MNGIILTILLTISNIIAVILIGLFVFYYYTDHIESRTREIEEIHEIIKKLSKLPRLISTNKNNVEGIIQTFNKLFVPPMPQATLNTWAATIKTDAAATFATAHSDAEAVVKEEVKRAMDVLHNGDLWKWISQLIAEGVVALIREIGKWAKSVETGFHQWTRDVNRGWDEFTNNWNNFFNR